MLTPDARPRIHVKLLFWLILGALSVFFAEVMCGNEPFALISPPMILLGFPVYFLHLMLLSSLAFRGGRPSFTVLYAGGMITGMYEAYITKVLFHPPWGDSPFNFLNVDIFWILVLVLWWHAFMAFMMPLVTADVVLTKGNEVVGHFPRPLRWIFSRKWVCVGAIVVLALFGGMFQGGNLPVLFAAISTPVNLLVLGGLLVIWRLVTRGRVYRMKELMPGNKGMIVMAVLVMVMYLIYTLGWRPEVLPGLPGQAIIVALYAVLFTLYFLNLKHSRNESPVPVRGWKFDHPLLLVLLFGLIATPVSIIMSLTGLGTIFLLLSFFAGILAGLTALIFTLKRAFLPVAKY